MLAIRYLRQERALSQRALADLVGTTQPAICNIEQGRLRPGDDLLGRIAGVLGVSPAFALLQPVGVELPATTKAVSA